MNKASILIVEDEPIISLDIESILKSLGYQVSGVVISGRECIEEVTKKRPDLILMDIKLNGEMDGIEAAKEIQKKFDIPIIFITAHSDKSTLQRVKFLKPYGYIVKPVTERDLYISIEISLYKHTTDKELKQSRENLRNLSIHLQSLREIERSDIAREIHDVLGQSLTALKMDLSWLTKRLDKEQDELMDKANSMSGLIDSIIQTVRRISSDLRPGILDDLGLSAALEWQADEFEKRTGIKCNVTFEPENVVIDEKYAVVVFRIFQESLTNIMRHANATEVNVKLIGKGNSLVLIVNDNGRGITDEQINGDKSLGLIGIRERAYSCGGEVTISGMKDKGTTVMLTIPSGGLQ